MRTRWTVEAAAAGGEAMLAHWGDRKIPFLPLPKKRKLFWDNFNISIFIDCKYERKMNCIHGFVVSEPDNKL